MVCLHSTRVIGCLALRPEHEYAYNAVTDDDTVLEPEDMFLATSIRGRKAAVLSAANKRVGQTRNVDHIAADFVPSQHPLSHVAPSLVINHARSLPSFGSTSSLFAIPDRLFTSSHPRPDSQALDISTPSS
ncbi:hypothetical protein FIBSPDRAFT_952907 [Athelia psychrophila]|uniref:Uncharacterized protein n=1 Tax=Athelia psychrophila TaxID=1759441 RepID=A0A166KVE1_9AGAM|nr:hypothetical protein FIBSPDRAFT_952907 [Fibularhizoctonia sp. CBS 109695]